MSNPYPNYGKVVLTNNSQTLELVNMQRAELAKQALEIERLNEVINLQVENYAELKEQYEAQGGYFNSVMVENDKAKKDAKLIDRKDAALRQVLTILEEEYVMPDEIETAITTIKEAQ